jgi:hypothetical protein
MSLSINEIAEGTNIRRRTVINAVQSLEKHGYLRVQRRRVGPKWNAPNQYFWLQGGSEDKGGVGSANIAPKEVLSSADADRLAPTHRSPSENPLRWKCENRGDLGVGFSGGAGAAAPVRAKRLGEDGVGREEVKISRMEARGKGTRQKPRPPDADEDRVVEHFQTEMRERIKAPVPSVTQTDRRAYRKLRWAYRSDEFINTDLVLDCITNACKIRTFPFYDRAFSLREFCNADPFHKFRTLAAPSKASVGGPANWEKKTIAQTVADRGRNYFLEVERIANLGDDEDGELEKNWLKEMQTNLAKFCHYTGWDFRDVDRSEVDVDFVESISDIYSRHCSTDAKPLLPGILMCKVIDICRDNRIPFPRSFTAYKDIRRAKERKLSSDDKENYLENHSAVIEYLEDNALIDELKLYVGCPVP